MMLSTMCTHGPYYRNSGYLPCACAWPVRPCTDDTLVLDNNQVLNI